MPWVKGHSEAALTTALRITAAGAGASKLIVKGLQFLDSPAHRRGPVEALPQLLNVGTWREEAPTSHLEVYDRETTAIKARTPNLTADY